MLSGARAMIYSAVIIRSFVDFQIKGCLRHAVIAAQTCSNGGRPPLTGVDDRAVIELINFKWLSSEHACGSRGIDKDTIGRNP
jgi:hypothetical protein